MRKYETRKLRHTKISEARHGHVYAATYRFSKVRVYRQRNGDVNEVPFTDEAVLLRIGYGDRQRSVWLTHDERRRALEALQEVGHLGGPAPKGNEEQLTLVVAQQTRRADSQEESDEPAKAEVAGVPMSTRLAVHRQVEWLRATGTWPDWMDFQEDAVGALSGVLGELAADEEYQDLLIAEVGSELARLDVVATTGLDDVDGQVANLLDRPAEQTGPCDAFGELAGGRVSCTQLLYRPTGPEQVTGTSEEVLVSEDESGVASL